MSRGQTTSTWTTGWLLGAAAGGIALGVLLERRRLRRADLLPFEREAAKLDKTAVLDKRKKMFSAAQSISYENKEPLMALQGDMQYLEDSDGQRYLDTRNNVGHVGWQHPKVVGAVQRQMARLNCNQRYLHPNHVLLAEKLTKTFPDELCVCFFVNSGSEANDLAMRLARSATGGSDFIVADHAYHGHTEATLELSPYKYQKRKKLGLGEGRQPWVHQIACPDIYRGLHRTPQLSEADAVERYVAEVSGACAAAEARRESGGTGVAAFFIESGMSVAGVILPPEGYLAKCYESVRAAGGVCVADEVQVGFGRFGEHFWGFQQQGVVPDIVTMGKPFGNGTPLAAVVCRREIADKFANGIEYFNTFGGNAVSCAAGLAMLDVMELEGLQDNAVTVGKHLKAALTKMMDTPAGALIGQVRGSGLFIGIDFVTDREARTPATAQTSILCSKLKEEHHILTSIDGPHDNVLVMKPPMSFSTKDADLLIEKMALVLQGITREDVANFSHCPT